MALLQQSRRRGDRQRVDVVGKRRVRKNCISPAYRLANGGWGFCVVLAQRCFIG